MRPQDSLLGQLTLVPLMATGALLILLSVVAFVVRKRTRRIRVPARLESIRWLTRLVDEMGREARLSEQAIFQCRLALDEACANIINHSYGDRGGEIEAVISAQRGICRIQLTDFGEPYDPAVVSQPARPRTIDEVKPGGLGLHLIRSVMDEVRYTPGRRGNHLVMIKNCRSEAAS